MVTYGMHERARSSATSSIETPIPIQSFHVIPLCVSPQDTIFSKVSFFFQHVKNSRQTYHMLGHFKTNSKQIETT